MELEKIVFQKTLEYKLIEKCGEDKPCAEAVKNLTPTCMDAADWKSLMKNQDDEVEQLRFMKTFYSCIVDADGNPYFEI